MKVARIIALSLLLVGFVCFAFMRDERSPANPNGQFLEIMTFAGFCVTIAVVWALIKLFR
jgi:hypothetical protein